MNSDRAYLKAQRLSKFFPSGYGIPYGKVFKIEVLDGRNYVEYDAIWIDRLETLAENGISEEDICSKIFHEGDAYDKDLLFPAENQFEYMG